MVGAMRRKDVGRGALLLLIAAAAIVGGIALIRGHWIVLAAMVLVILSQALAFRKASASLARRDSEEANGRPREHL
jgi:uncharacterized membrane protein YhaH (DUF805 family)